MRIDNRIGDSLIAARTYDIFTTVISVPYCTRDPLLILCACVHRISLLVFSLTIYHG